MIAPTIVWSPQTRADGSPGPQYHLCSCPVADVLFGGARGGGKTDGLLGDWLGHAGKYGRNARGILFRRSMPELEEVQRRAKEIFLAIGAYYLVQQKTWIFPNGAELKLRYLDADSDADHYQGHQYTWIGFDEAGNWPNSAPIDKMRACLRSALGVPCVMRLTGNPGGVGHFWLKKRYIDPAAPMTPHRDPTDGIQRVFIPSRLEDNLILQRNDPDYRSRVRASGPGWLVKAWLEGDWTGPPTGGYFRPGWMRTYARLPRLTSKYLSIDLAGQTTKSSDNTAILPWGLDEEDYLHFLPDMLIAKMTTLTSSVEILRLAERHDVLDILMEEGHYSIGIKPFLTKMMAKRRTYVWRDESYHEVDGTTSPRSGEKVVEVGGRYFHIEPMPTAPKGLHRTGSAKRDRNRSLQAMMENGRVLWPDNDLYRLTIQPHFLAFTGDGVEADDEIDAAGHVALYLNRAVRTQPPKPKPAVNVDKKRWDEIERRQRRGTDETIPPLFT